MLNNEAADIAMAPQLGSFQVVGLSTPENLCFKILSLVFPFYSWKTKIKFSRQNSVFLAIRLSSQTIWFLKQSEFYIFYSFKRIRSFSKDFWENFTKFFAFSKQAKYSESIFKKLFINFFPRFGITCFNILFPQECKNAKSLKMFILEHLLFIYLHVKMCNRLGFCWMFQPTFFQNYMVHFFSSWSHSADLWLMSFPYSNVFQNYQIDFASWVPSTAVCLWGTHPLKSRGFCSFGIVILVKCWKVLLLLTALDIQNRAFNTTCFVALKKASINNFLLLGFFRKKTFLSES